MITLGLLMEKKIVIERKSVADFINSVRDGRLETQLTNLEQV